MVQGIVRGSSVKPHCRSRFGIVGFAFATVSQQIAGTDALVIVRKVGGQSVLNGTLGVSDAFVTTQAWVDWTTERSMAGFGLGGTVRGTAAVCRRTAGTRGFGEGHFPSRCLTLERIPKGIIHCGACIACIPTDTLVTTNRIDTGSGRMTPMPHRMILAQQALVRIPNCKGNTEALSHQRPSVFVLLDDTVVVLGVGGQPRDGAADQVLSHVLQMAPFDFHVHYTF